jgi:hypothetical protein
MRLRCAFVLAAFLSVLPLALGGDRAASLVQSIRPSSLSERQLVLEAKFLCGMFDGSFACKNVPGAVMHGKNAAPGAPEETDQPEGMTGGAEQGTTAPIDTGQGTSGGTPDAATTCQHGMVGTPPNCQCPKNSELLGGNCVHYTASACSNGLASDALPQACRGAEEKLSCTMRQDGLKGCCCLTYDKF